MKVTSILLKGFLYTIATFIAIVIASVVLVYFNRDKIINATLSEVNKHIKARIEINPDIDVSILQYFPKISINFKKVDVYEPGPARNIKFAHFDQINVSFDALNFYNHKYIVDNLQARNGFLHLRIDQSGNRNFDIIKADTVRSTNGSLNLDDIVLENIEVNYQDDRNSFLYSCLLHTAKADLTVVSDKTSIKLNAELLVHEIKIQEDIFFKEKQVSLKTSLDYFNEKHLTKIHESSIVVEKGTLDFMGEVETKTATRLDLQVEERGCNIQTLLSLLPESQLKGFRQYESEGKINFSAIVKGYIDDKTSPGIDVKFGFANASFYHPTYKLRIKKVSLGGYFSNGIEKKSKTSVLKLAGIKALFDGRAINGFCNISNFDDPFLDLEVKGIFNLAVVTKLYPIKEISKVKGFANTDLQFNGRVKNLQKLETSELVKVSGEVDLSDVEFSTPSLNFPIKGLSGDLTFNNNDIAVSDLKFSFGSTDINFDGILKNLLGRVIYRKRHVMVEAEITSNFLSLDELSAAQKQKTITSTSSQVSQAIVFPSYLKLDLQCGIKRLKYQKFHARNLIGKILISHPNLKFENVQAEVADGKVHFNSESVIDDTGFTSIISDIKVTSLGVDSVFFMFDNFNQDFITNKNIKGEYSGNIKLKMMCGPSWDIIPASINSSVEGSLQNGQLLNFEPMKKLARFMDEEKLSHIYFSELRNNIFIENEKIFIPEMEIKSSLSNILVSGTHTFNQDIDYKLTVPLKNFKKERVDKDEAFGAIEKNVQTGGSNVFVTIKGTTEDFKIAYDKKKTAIKMKQDLKKEREELRVLFKKKKPEPMQEPATEQEFFDFD